MKALLESRTGTVLVLVNLIPLFGVIFAGWNVFEILFLFWMENVVIGIFNVGKMLNIRKPDPGNPARTRRDWTAIPTAFFFAFHYGGFCLGHGVFVVVMACGLFTGHRPGGIPTDLLLERAGELFSAPVVLTAFSLVVSHGYSFLYNYLGRGECLRVTARELLFAPYPRVIVVHTVIVFGGILTQKSGSSMPMMILLVVMKITLDLVMHLREHRSGAPSPVPSDVLVSRRTSIAWFVLFGVGWVMFFILQMTTKDVRTPRAGSSAGGRALGNKEQSGAVPRQFAQLWHYLNHFRNRDDMPSLDVIVKRYGKPRERMPMELVLSNLRDPSAVEYYRFGDEEKTRERLPVNAWRYDLEGDKDRWIDVFVRSSDRSVMGWMFFENVPPGQERGPPH